MAATVIGAEDDRRFTAAGEAENVNGAGFLTRKYVPLQSSAARLVIAAGSVF